jgi:hypothetical protein
MLMPEEGATLFTEVSNFLLQFGYELHHTGGEFTERAGGPELAVLQECGNRLLVVAAALDTGAAPLPSLALC